VGAWDLGKEMLENGENHDNYYTFWPRNLNNCFHNLIRSSRALLNPLDPLERCLDDQTKVTLSTVLCIQGTHHHCYRPAGTMTVFKHSATMSLVKRSPRVGKVTTPTNASPQEDPRILHSTVGTWSVPPGRLEPPIFHDDRSGSYSPTTCGTPCTLESGTHLVSRSSS